MPIPHTDLSSRIEPPVRKEAQKQIPDPVCKVPPLFQEIKHVAGALPFSRRRSTFGEVDEILCWGKRILHSKFDFRQLFLGKLFQLTSCENKRCCRSHLSCCKLQSASVYLHCSVTADRISARSSLPGLET